MKRVAILMAVCALALIVPTGAFAGQRDTVDPALMQPPLNPTFAPYDCWWAGDRIICEGTKTESYAGLEVDFLACDAGIVYATGSYTSITRRTGDAEGRALRTTFRDAYLETFSLNPDGTGPTLTSFGRSNKVFVYAVPGELSSRTESILGLEIRVTGPGLGVLLHDVGMRTWDSEGNLLKVGGSHLDEETFGAAHDRICDAFEQLGS